jgi:hypothetical protein
MRKARGERNWTGDGEGQAWWLTPVIPVIQEAEIQRLMVQYQPRQNISEILSTNKLGMTA